MFKKAYVVSILLVLTSALVSSEENVVQCSTNDKDGVVIGLSDGTYDRCIAAIIPESTEPLPVLFWFHGAGGAARFCGGARDASGWSLIDYAKEYGFAVVCGEALQNILGNGGIWNIPQVQTDVTGPVCSDDDSLDAIYMKNVVKVLEEQSEKFDTSRLYPFGCSLGSAFSEWTAVCMHQWYDDERVTTFGTHSTGLKIKGDGNRFPPDPYTGDSWGECPDCQYFPTVPVKTGQKACLADNTEDPTPNNPYFYRSTEQMNEKWKEAGNRAEMFLHSGGHCQFKDWMEILTCLDDGTGKLLGKRLRMETSLFLNFTLF